MDNSNACGLKIKQIIAILIILIILALTAQLFKLNQTKTLEIAEETLKTTDSMEKAQVEEKDNFEREEQVTSRGAEERTIEEQTTKVEEVEEEQPQYISIEEISISRDMDLSKRCGVSREDFIKLMENMKVDSSGFFAENAGTIYDVCEKYELNEVFFCGLIGAESGWKIASNHRNACNYISMMSGGKLIKYSTPEAGLEAAAKLLHSKYLTPGGSCYYGKTLSAVQKRFCPNSSTWVGLVYGCMKQVVK